MSNHLQFLSTLFLGICLLVGSWFISTSFDSKVRTPIEQQYRYEFISANEQNIIIFDKQTGEYWRKFIEPNEGPTNWEKQESPVQSVK